MAEYVPPTLPPLPPEPPRPAAWSADVKPQWDAYWSWVQQAQQRAEFLSVDRERWSLQQHRATCSPAVMVDAFTPTIDAVLAAWGALDVRLGQLAAALGYKPPAPPAPPAPPPFML